MFNLINKNKLLFKNISYLALFQASNYILPFFVFPYLIKVVGIDKFGLVSLAQALALYLNVFIEYGFNYSATRFISNNRNEKKLVNETLTSVLAIKAIFFVLVFIIYAIIIFIVPSLKINAFLFLSGYLILLGLTLFPIWLFQGIEKLKHITIANFIGKLITVLTIFVFIKSPEDYVYILILYAFGSLVTAILGLVYLQSYGFKFVKISKNNIRYHLQSGYSIFISSLGINLYRNLNIILVGFFTTNSITGIYSVAEKFLKAIQMMVSPITLALFPNSSKKIYGKTKEEGKNYIQNLKKYLFKLLLAIFAFSLLLSPIASLFFFKKFNPLFFYIFLILSPIIILGGLNYLLGVVGMMNFGKEKLFTKSIFAGALINMIGGVIGGVIAGVYGISFSFLLAELTVFIMLTKYFKSL